MTARELGYQIGQVAAPIIFIGIGAYLGWKMGQKRQPPKFVVWPLAVAILLTVGALALKIQKKSQSEASTYGELR